MNEIKIKCPTCGKILRIPDQPGINEKTIKCPVCNAKSVVGNCQRYVEQDSEKTQYSNGMSPTTDTEKTRIVASPTVSVGTLVDNFGRTYNLRIGVNTIGRMANSSTATVQINTQDRTMSRNHAIIEVQNAGGQIIHILKNGANKNPSYFNGALIGPTDQMILNNGDRLKLGLTELTFKK